MISFKQRWLDKRAKLKHIKEQKRVTLSATDETTVAGLARINSFRAVQDTGIDRLGDRRVGRKTMVSAALG